jgi:type IV secretion system protein TrbL
VSAFRSGGLSGEAGASTAASPLRSAAAQSGKESGTPGEAGNPDAPAWVRRMKRAQMVSHGVSTATQAVRSSDHGGGGASVDLSNADR